MRNKRLLLIGNANVGKTTLFNRLSGLNQKTGNYPGVTVDKKIGKFRHGGVSFELIDLPGISSVYPTSIDEELVVNYLKTLNSKTDTIVFVANAIELKKSLYLFSQIKDLGFPISLVINLADVAEKKGIYIDEQALENSLGVNVINVSARNNTGIEALKNQLIVDARIPIFDPLAYAKPEVIEEIKSSESNSSNYYQAFLDFVKTNNRKDLIRKESILRYQLVNKWLKTSLKVDKSKAKDFTGKLDRFLLHPIFGYVAFFGIMLIIFQSVFWLATYPMDGIESGMGLLKDSVAISLPEGMLNDLLVNGILEGLGGVIIFIPQIAILFFFFSLLEESGYMARAVFLLDKPMQKIGMSGKSVVPLVSSFACAVPAIMSARTIGNYKERLITILVSPLITCSARIPVYTIIIAVVIPDDSFFGIGSKGLALFCMYLIGIITTVIAALVFKWILKGKFKSLFIISMPDYLMPSFKNIGLSVLQNTKSFVLDAGKIIVAVTILIFVLQSNGNDKFNQAELLVENQYSVLNEEEKELKIEQIKSENSYLAIAGKSIEPIIAPLGYDWKMGIGVIASIAAREVFVGTMAVVYGSTEEEKGLIDKFSSQTNTITGEKSYSFATGVSLLLFYAFSLQCMSTIAVTYKETKSLKWTSIQFLYMTGLAYLASLIAYQLLA